jgi:hypothetical protein
VNVIDFLIMECQCVLVRAFAGTLFEKSIKLLIEPSILIRWQFSLFVLLSLFLVDAIAILKVLKMQISICVWKASAYCICGMWVHMRYNQFYTMHITIHYNTN